VGRSGGGERYLLQFWPAPPAIDRVVRQTTKQAAYWHQVARDRPPPAPRPPEDERLRRERERLTGAGTLAAPPATPRRPRIPTGLARLDPDLAGKVAAAPPDVQRAIAVWAAHRACEVAGIAGLDWVAAGLDALDKGEPLPPPFDHMPDAFDRLHGANSAGHVTFEITTLPDGERPPRIDARLAALPAIPAATRPAPPPTPCGPRPPPTATTSRCCSTRSGTRSASGDYRAPPWRSTGRR
jgi:hypothetical protein